MGHSLFEVVPALACNVHEPQSLWKCPCCGGDHLWAVDSQGCSYPSACHSWATVPSGHPHCGLQSLQRCTSSGMEHLWRIHLHLCPQGCPCMYVPPLLLSQQLPLFLGHAWTEAPWGWLRFWCVILGCSLVSEPAVSSCYYTGQLMDSTLQDNLAAPGYKKPDVCAQ